MTTHKKHAVTNEDKPEFIGQVIDIFEDFLADRNIILPNEERDEEEDPEARTIIYGSDYDYLYEKITNTMQRWNIIAKE